MAIYHCSIKIGSRGKGQSAVAAAAYRSGSKLTDKEIGITSDYTRKGGVIFSEISLCPNAPAEYAEREVLWNAVHQIEKTKDARLWREIEVALPKELNRAEQIETVREYVKGLTTQGMCADWSLHDKGDGNPHAHIMLTVRSIEPSGKWAPKSRKVYDLDENGQRIFQKIDKSGRKQYKCHKEDHNNWNAAERVEEWRAAWAECCNAHLAADVQVDHRSYERQGIDLIPTVHEGYIARKLAAQGLPSDRVQINENIRKRNFLLQRLMSQLKALGKEILRLSGLREAAEVKNDVIISEFDGINKIANVKPKVRKTVPNPKIEIYDSPKQSSVFKKPTGISAVVKTMPKSESIVIEPEIQRLVGLRNKCISQGVIITWLRFNSVKNDAQADLSKAKELETNFEACVTDYFKARNNYRLHRDQTSSLRLESAEYMLDKAAQEVQNYLGFMICPYFSENDIHNQIDRLRSTIKRHIDKKQVTANAEIEKNKKIEALAAEHITDDNVRHTFGIYKKACAEMPESLWPKAIDVIYSIKMPDPIGKFWDNKSLRFYDQAKERICETAAKYMPISSDLKHQEEINNYISYGGQR